MNKPETWQCLLCRMSSDFNDDSQAISSIYKTVEENSNEPFAKVLCFFTTRLRQQCLEISSLKKELEVLQQNRGGEDIDMNETDSKTKRILLIGNDLHHVRAALKERLPAKSNYEVVNHRSASMLEISNEIKQILETDNEESVFSLYIHPGIEECLLQEEEIMIAALKSLIAELSKSYPSTEVNIISVPQVLKDSCLRVNNTFQMMAEKNEINYISLTKIQAELVLQNKRTYCEATSLRIASVLADKIAAKLKVKLVRPPKKSKAEKKSAEDPKNSDPSKKQPKVDRRRGGPPPPQRNPPSQGASTAPQYATTDAGFYRQGQYMVPSNTPQPHPHTVYQFVQPALPHQPPPLPGEETNALHPVPKPIGPNV